MPPRRSDAQTQVEEVAASPSAGRRTAGRQPPWERGAEADAASFGSWLRRQRELREISLRDVAERTKISLRYLEAMEDDRFDLLPAPVFAKGFLREYARYIGLSPDEVVNHYIVAHGIDNGEAAGEEPAPERAAPGPRRRGLLLLALALLALALAIAAWVYRERRGAEPPPGPAGDAAAAAPGVAAGEPEALVPVLPATVPVASEPPAAPAAAPRSPLEVTLDFTRDCWVEATVDGKPVIAEQRVAGESLQIPAQREVVLTKLGNAVGVEAQVNGYPFPLPVADEGQVLRDVRIDLATVESLRQKNPG